MNFAKIILKSNTNLQFALWCHILPEQFEFFFLSILLSTFCTLLFAHSSWLLLYTWINVIPSHKYTLLNFWHGVKMATSYKEEDIFPAAYQPCEFQTELESLKDRKDCSNHKLDAAIEMLCKIHPNLHKFVVRQLIIKNMQMLISSCEWTREFLVKQLNIKPAMKIDPEVVIMPTLSNLKEGVSLLMYNIGLLQMHINGLNKSTKVPKYMMHCSIFYIHWTRILRYCWSTANNLMSTLLSNSFHVHATNCQLLFTFKILHNINIIMQHL